MGYYDMALFEKLTPMMEKYNVQAYINGHKHTLEHIQEKNKQSDDDLHYFTIGAGAILDPLLGFSEIIAPGSPPPKS